MGIADLVATRCAICGTLDNATELYPARFHAADLNPGIFSARRAPDRVHFRMVRCATCGLVRSDPVAGPEELNGLYRDSRFDYHDQVEDLQATYGRYLARLARRADQGGERAGRGGRAAGGGGERGGRSGARAGSGGEAMSLLEAGCGNGFALEEALRRGFATVRGVEPSTAAVADASPLVAPAIVCDIMRPGLFDPGVFDAVCLFQMFDHVPDPAGLLEECWTVLKPGGHILILNHNVEALSARVLRGRSPIIDIEHTYLYGPATLARICTAHRFEVREQGPVWNRAQLGYLTRLAPVPASLRWAVRAVVDATGVGRLCVTLPLGNLYVIAQKPR